MIGYSILIDTIIYKCHLSSNKLLKLFLYNFNYIRRILASSCKRHELPLKTKEDQKYKATILYFSLHCFLIFILLKISLQHTLACTSENNKTHLCIMFKHNNIIRLFFRHTMLTFFFHFN